MKTIAIIDLGTNIFNLLVARKNGTNNFEIIHEGKLPVKLGEGGITKGYITPEAWLRGINALKKHIQTAKELGTQHFYAFATSATRDARNGQEFVNEIRNKLGINVEIIDGKREATLIYKGVKQAVNLGLNCSMIVDIGGGSNEIILANSNEIFWLQSFNLGVSRLVQQFNPADPITSAQIDSIENYINNQIEPLFNAVKKYKPKQIVGSSGSFDSFRSILEQAGRIEVTTDTWANISVQDYLKLHQQFIHSTRSERLSIQGLDPIRVDFIVVASIFVNFLVQHFNIERILQSEYALKEGFLSELTESVQ